MYSQVQYICYRKGTGLWEMLFFSIAMYNFCKLKKTSLITVIIHKAHVGLIVNTINNTDLNVIETVFHDMFSVRCEFQVKFENILTN